MNRLSKSAIGIFLLSEIALLIKGGQILFGNQEKELGVVALGMGTLCLPFIFMYLANQVDLKLPPGFQVIFVVFITLAQYFGEVQKFYQSFWWWDLSLHGIFGLFAVLFAIYTLKKNTTKTEQVSESRFNLLLIIASFCFAISCSTLWEIFEYLGDILLPVKMVKGGFEDTMSDMIIGALAALLTSLGYYLWWWLYHRKNMRGITD